MTSSVILPALTLYLLILLILSGMERGVAPPAHVAMIHEEKLIPHGL